MSRHQPSLPSNRMFAVQLHAEAEVEHGQYYGRVEHINSFQATHFASMDELLAFMARVFAAQEQAEAEDLPAMEHPRTGTAEILSKLGHNDSDQKL